MGGSLLDGIGVLFLGREWGFGGLFIIVFVLLLFSPLILGHLARRQVLELTEVWLVFVRVVARVVGALWS